MSDVTIIILWNFFFHECQQASNITAKVLSLEYFVAYSIVSISVNMDRKTYTMA